MSGRGRARDGAGAGTVADGGTLVVVAVDDDVCLWPWMGEG